MAEINLFKLPTNPEEFGVVLEPASLRRIDFSALEFAEMRRAFIEYVKTYFPTQFNDFVTNNGIIMMQELVAYVGDVLSQRSDVIADESFLPTSQTEVAVDQHLFLINNAIRRATPAVVDVEISISTEAPTPIRIPAGFKFNISGADGLPLTYELYRTPGDFDNEIVIFPGTRGVIGFGIEGAFATPFTTVSAGGPDQEIEISGSNILSSPMVVDVSTDNTTVRWTRVDNKEQYGANDEVYEVRLTDSGATIRFGNDIAGKAPLSGQIVTVGYRVGGGTRGRIITNAINETRTVIPDAPVSAPVVVLFRNPNPSNGGLDQETLDAAKRRAPKESATHKSAISGEDYSILAKTFNHPIYGSVLKAVATVRTSINANIVEVYVLAVGPGDVPVLPSIGLKQGLETYFSEINVLTDEIRVFDAAIKTVDIEATVVIHRNADPSQIRTAVDDRISNFFNPDNYELGQPFYVSNLYDALQDIDGVKFVKIFNPADNIINSGEIAGSSISNTVGFNELLTLGEVKVRIYFEKAQFGRLG